MPHSNYDAILCDIDGCLSPEAPGAMNLAALGKVAAWNRRAREDGDAPRLTLCTGRPLPFTEAMARAVGAFDLPIVCESGVWLLEMDPYRWAMDPQLTPEHLDMARSMQAWVGESFKGVFFEAGKSAAVTVFHRDGPKPLRDEIQPAIKDEIARRGWPLRTAMTWTCVNIEPEFISKGTGIDRLIEQTGLKPDRLAGIGDTMSDVPIRERVAWFACPANADERLKELADYVSEKEEAEGVLEILERLENGAL